ncbi:MAG: hypothetical protein WA705_27975 [Candidatus Ozemobacteraceae bacterium]
MNKEIFRFKQSIRRSLQRSLCLMIVSLVFCMTCFAQAVPAVSPAQASQASSSAVSSATPAASTPGSAQSDEPVVKGEPVIGMNTVRNHLRLMEFVLGTRFTTSQKEKFLASVKTECADMERANRLEFLSANELVASMATMKANQLDAVKCVLQADFEESAKEDASDPAAQLYLSLEGALGSAAAGTGSFTVTLQALEAFDEFLGFVRGLPQAPKALTTGERDTLMKTLVAHFEELTEDKKAALTGFDRRWHLFKAAFLGSSNDKVESWKKDLSKPLGEKGSVAFDKTFLGSVIQPTLWKEISDAGIALGETESGWATSSTVSVW